MCFLIFWCPWGLNGYCVSLLIDIISLLVFILLSGVGLGFLTSMLFIFFIGVFASSWLGGTVFWLGEWFIKRLPFMKHIYSASKQISAAISPGNASLFGSPDLVVTSCHCVRLNAFPRIVAYVYIGHWKRFSGWWYNFLFSVWLSNRFPLSHADQNTTAFKEVAIIRHPRLGEYAFGFITSSVVLQVVTLPVQVDFCTWHCAAWTRLRGPEKSPVNDHDGFQQFCAINFLASPFKIGTTMLYLVCILTNVANDMPLSDWFKW